MKTRDRKYLLKILLTPGQRRHALRWVRSLRPHYLTETPSPWLTFDAIEALEGWLKPGMRVFEYGSGGSTLYWLSRGAEVVSVEHDAAWYGIVKQKLPAGAKADYRLVEADPAATPAPAGDVADPAAYLSQNPDFVGRTFRSYATQIDAFPDGHFDLVLVDGRARPSCVAHGARKVRPGGLLVLDNAERPHYLAKAGAALAGFSRRAFPGVAPCNRVMHATDLFTRG
jgi:hypothetical protein